MIGTKVGPFYVGGHPVRGAARGASSGLGVMAWMIIAIVGGAFYVLVALVWLLRLIFVRFPRWMRQRRQRRRLDGKPVKVKVVKPTKAERRVVKARAKLVDAQMTDAARRNRKRMPGSTLPPPKVF